ncbi:MAG: hypothetical protein ACJZ46_01800, partial [Candidatus Thalassarchaeaceae archaeon]
FILKQPSNSREKTADRCARDLENLRINLKPSDLLISAFPNQFLESGLRNEKIMKAWEHGSNLIRICREFLHGLEKKYPDSNNLWAIDIEVPLHLNRGEYIHSPPSKRNIANQEFGLHGSIDLVFKWENIRVLGELKTGKYSKEKEKNWKDQVAIYADVWKEKYPKHKIIGVVFHASKKPIYIDKLYNYENLQDNNRRVGGAQCNECHHNITCDMSKFNGRLNHFN